MGPLFIPQATTTTTTSTSPQRGAATTAMEGEEDVSSSTTTNITQSQQEQPTYSQIIEHEHGHNHNDNDDDLIVPINYNNLNHHVPKLQSHHHRHNFVHYHDAHPNHNNQNHSSLYDTGQDDNDHPPPPPPPLMLRPTNTHTNENGRNNCPQSLSSSSSLSRSDNNLLRKYIILLQDCVAIKFIPCHNRTTTATAATTPAEYEAFASLTSRMVNGGVPSGIVAGGGEGGSSSLLLSSSASTGDDDINHDVNHSQQGIFLFKIFRDSNLKCYWNPSIIESISSLQFKGYLIPSTILLSSHSPQHLNTLRTAYSRRILRHPPGYRIELLAEIEEIVAQPVQQGQFAPLSDSLCWAILELTSGGREAFVESIMEVLVGGSFPGMMRSGLPRQELVYQTLEKLIREQRIYQTSKGYHVVTPEVSSFMNYSRCVTPGGGGRMGMVTPTMMGTMMKDPLYFNAHNIPKQHSSWGSTGSVLEHEDLLFNRRRSQAAATPLRRHHSLKIIRRRDRVGDDGSTIMTPQPCMGARSLSFRLSKVNSLFDSDKEEGDGDDDDYGYFEEFDHDQSSINTPPNYNNNTRRSNSRCCNRKISYEEGVERRISMDNEQRGVGGCGEDKGVLASNNSDSNNNNISGAKKRRSFFRRWLYNSFRRLKRPGPTPGTTSVNLTVANNNTNSNRQPIHLQQLPKSPRQTVQAKQNFTTATSPPNQMNPQRNQPGRQIKSTCSSSTQTLNKISKSSEHLPHIDMLSQRIPASRRIHSSSSASSSSNSKFNSLPSHNRYNHCPQRKSILSESSPFYDDLIGAGGHPPQRSSSRRSLTPSHMGHIPNPYQFQPQQQLPTAHTGMRRSSSPCPTTIRNGHPNMTTAPNRVPPPPPPGQATSAASTPGLHHPISHHQKRAYPRVFQRYNKCCSAAPGANPQAQHLSAEQQPQIRTGHRHHPRIIPTRPRVATTYQIYSSSSEQHEKEMLQLLTHRQHRQQSSSSSSTRSSTTTTVNKEQPPIRSSSLSTSQKNKIHKLDDNHNEELIITNSRASTHHHHRQDNGPSPNMSNANNNIDDELLITTRMMKGGGDHDIPLIPHDDANPAKNPIVPRNGDDRNSIRGSSDDVSH